MKRALVQTPAFLRSIKRYLKKHPDAATGVKDVLTLMSDDVFQPKLRTHKLKGDLSGSWASSGGYDLRIIFRFTQIDGVEGLLLLAIGTHDEVY